MAVKSANTVQDLARLSAAKEAVRQYLLAADKYLKESHFDLGRQQLERTKQLDPTNVYICSFQDRIAYFEEKKKKDAASHLLAAPGAGPSQPHVSHAEHVTPSPQPHPTPPPIAQEFPVTPQPTPENQKPKGMSEELSKEEEKRALEQLKKQALAEREAAEKQRQRELEARAAAEEQRRRKVEARTAEEERRREAEARAAEEQKKIEEMRRQLEDLTKALEQEKKAREKIEKVNPNLILCDTYFPNGLSGIKFLYVIRANPKFNFIPIILIGEPGELALLHSSELKPNEGVIKQPIDYDELTAVINEKLAYFREYISSIA